MRSRPPLLFCSASIFDVIANATASLTEVIRQLSAEEIESAGAAERAISPFLLNVPVLDEAGKYAESREVDIDVSGDPMRMVFDRSRPCYIKGSEIIIAIPFSGDPEVFRIRPTTSNLNPPMGYVEGNELRMVFTITREGVSVNAELDRNIGQVKQYLEWLRPSAEQMKLDLTRKATDLIAQRKLQANAHAQLVGGLGIPVRQAQSRTATGGSRVVAQKLPDGRTSSTPYDWDVFISHATEDKEQAARPLAEALQSKGFRVWFDEFSLKVGDSLRQSIDRGLARSRYGVVILSPHFFEKHWPTQELNGLAGREAKGRKVILPVWFNVERADVQEYSPTLADRLAVPFKIGLERVIEKLTDAM